MDDTISRQAAIDELWSLDAELRPSAIDAILNMLNGLPSEQPEQRWIPCSEEPDNDRAVFIARGEPKFMSVCIGYYDHDYKQWYESRNWFAKCLYDGLYWCEIPPLPEPYGGEQE